ncbi:TPA: DUF2784 family protein [Candidatus Saccharibacteria bacterium]|nr:DUF2784 family protein [Candidatus Saccharibacteria bacterium]HIO87782.1 DUF2784 family protein [Candidatus Saccharibacteria bacterium]
MSNRVKANMAALFHLLWILLIVFGLPMGIFYELAKTLTTVLIAVTIVSWVIFKGCLPQQLEQKWRPEMGGRSFIQFYTKKFADINVSRRTVRSLVVLYFLLVIIVFYLI